MAKYILAVDVDRFRGSLQGATFQRCGKVFAIRKRAVIVQKNSEKQSKSKNRFGSLASRFKTLTNAEKTSFNSSAAVFTRVNSLDENYNFSGQNMQIGTNAVRVITNQNIINTASSQTSFTTISEDTFSVDLSDVAFDIVPDPFVVNSDFSILVFASRTQASGIASTSSSFKLIGTFSSGEDTRLRNFFDQYVAVWGSLENTANLFISLRLDLIRNSNGQIRQSLYGIADITI